MKSRQLNIRLSQVDRDRLEALAFLRRTPASTLARQLVLDYLDLHSGEPGMADALRSLATHDEAEDRTASIRSLRPGTTAP